MLVIAGEWIRTIKYASDQCAVAELEEETNNISRSGKEFEVKINTKKTKVW